MLQVFVGILRSYTIAIAVLVIVAETEWELLFRFFGVRVLCFVLLKIFYTEGYTVLFVFCLTTVIERSFVFLF